MDAGQGHFQPATEYLQGWRLHNCSGKLAPVVEYSNDDFYFLMFKEVSYLISVLPPFDLSPEK